ELAGNEGGEAPSTVTLIGGDVHMAYVAEVALSGAQRSRVSQVVCPPFRNPLSPREQRVIRLTATKGAGAVLRTLARLAGVRRAAAEGRFLRGAALHHSDAA